VAKDSNKFYGADHQALMAADKKKKQAKKPKKKIKVSPGKSYYSSKSLRDGFEQTLPAAQSSEQTKKRSPLGKNSPRAALLEAVQDIQDLFRGDEGKVGSRMAKEVAKQEVVRKSKGGMVKPRGVGQASGGWGKAMRSR
jgi:hypothetical protein|tara:strand:- start:1837 stop:2253 length:417 start_codon:yes stop_codon:yes gene_type:complete